MIRNARITDSEAILVLVNRNAGKGLMLRKSPYDIYRNILSFMVCEEDGRITGCTRLAVVWKDLAEVASLAVDDSYMKKGIGRMMIDECISRGRELGLKKLFALTYQVDFFSKCGFREVPRDSLPHKVFGDCLNCPKVECCDEHAFVYDL